MPAEAKEVPPEAGTQKSTKNTTKCGFRNRFLVIVEDYDIYPDVSSDAPNAKYVCVAIHGERKKG